MATELQNGFLLLEFLLALTLLSCLVVFVAQYQVMSVVGQKNAVEHTKALMQARLLMEQLLSGETAESTREINGIKLSWQVAVLENSVGSFGDQLQEAPHGFYMVRVDAQWNGTKNNSLHLMTGFYRHTEHNE